LGDGAVVIRSVKRLKYHGTDSVVQPDADDGTLFLVVVGAGLRVVKVITC
jgi:hypothetical protein